MKRFKDFGIEQSAKGFTGDKVKMAKILNREIKVHDFRIEDSKFNQGNNKKCLHLQIVVGETKHVVFTGSNALMETIQKIPKQEFPFLTTIVEENERFEFT